MGVRVKRILSLVAIASPMLLGGFVDAAQAQRASQNNNLQPLPEAMDDAFFTFDENFYRNSQFPRSATWFLGPFPENEIAGDGRVVNRVYNDALAQQAGDGPLMRVQDAENPYTYSIMTGSVTPEEDPIPAAFASPYSRSPVSSGGSNYSGGRSAVPALW
jgi:hypothetical protein